MGNYDVYNMQCSSQIIAAIVDAKDGDDGDDLVAISVIDDDVIGGDVDVVDDGCEVATTVEDDEIMLLL